MADSTVIKVASAYSPKGKLGQKYLATGKSIAMRLWDETAHENKESNIAREYETVGFVLDGSAELEIEGQTIRLEQGDSWVVPKGAKHTYRIKDNFRAVEATHPPAHAHARDE